MAEQHGGASRTDTIFVQVIRHPHFVQLPWSIEVLPIMNTMAGQSRIAKKYRHVHMLA